MHRVMASLRRDEDGQAMTEFALIVGPFLLLAAGIIYFGIALNQWHDMHRLANQGARYAVVNNFPGCPRTGPESPCTSPSLQEYIACSGQSLHPLVSVAFPAGGAKTKGSPVEVTVKTDFSFVPIIGVGTLTLTAKSSMRIEQDGTRYDAGTATC